MKQFLIRSGLGNFMSLNLIDTDSTKKMLSDAFARDDSSIGLLALCASTLEYPQLDISLEVKSLEELATVAHRRLAMEKGNLAKINILSEYLFDEVGFSGNRVDYYNPKNSYLHLVLARRMGIPLLLSILYMDVAYKVGIKCLGIGSPGHFLVAAPVEDEWVYIDAFNKGVIMEEVETKAFLTEILPKDQSWQEVFLDPVSNREIVSRIYRNLKHVYITSNQLEKAYSMIDLLVWLQPDDVDEVRDRGILGVQLGMSDQSLIDLKRYMSHNPVGRAAVDAQSLIEYLENRS